MSIQFKESIKLKKKKFKQYNIKSKNSKSSKYSEQKIEGDKNIKDITPFSDNTRQGSPIDINSPSATTTYVQKKDKKAN